MRSISLLVVVGALLACGSAAAPPRSVAPTATANKPTPLILEKLEGERRVWREIVGVPGSADPSHFILKVDPRNGGSSHLVFGTEDLGPGDNIEEHRHPGADEIVFLQNGTARASVGGETREVHGGATVFIPANTLISLNNTGKETIHLVFVFSAPGFEEFMRAESVREGEKNTPLTKAEDAAIMKRHARAVVYTQP
ncbi:MAG TPA: cupin domain-containing protein [Candidatus Acidoferrales bacterium]|nr:cupin domain-containing protein [Candidatus Acidoferrales bacterium]